MVLGQPDFQSTGENRGAGNGSPSANTMDAPYGNAWLDNGVLYVGDWGNSRLLGFSGVPTTNGVSATSEQGQADLSHETVPVHYYPVEPQPTAQLWGGPETVQVAGGKLVTNDVWDNRVLIFNSVPSVSNSAADVVVGQPDMSHNNPDPSAYACTSTGMDHPESVFITPAGKMIVADSNNDRVLIYNSIPTVNGAAPDLVLGQSSASACSAGSGTPSLSTFWYPSDAWSDDQRLVVADFNNNRVLVWTTFPTSNGQAADLVLGQAAPNTRVSGSAATQMFSPYYVTSNGTVLAVADNDNNRVLVWSAFPATNDAPADVVLGQGGFNHGQANDDNQDGVQDAAASDRTLNQPSGVRIIGTQLIVADRANHRVLVYQGN